MDHQTQTPLNWPPTLKRVIQTIERYGMVTSGENVLVGVSGGPDSMALLHILYALAPHFRIHLAVAHVNHGLRPVDADKDENFVKQTAGALHLPFYNHQANIRANSGSIEEKARKARYDFFFELMQGRGYDKIALGHQKNDNAEAVLMHLLRGSGIRGLSGIPPVRENRVIRPLIQLDRSEIMAYIKDNNIAFRIDTSNSDPAFDRNRIRQHLIPLLKKDYNANIIETLNRTADLCREEEIWFNTHLRTTLDKALYRSEKHLLELDGRVLMAQPLAVQRRLIRESLRHWHGHLKRMSAPHIDAVIRLLPAEAVGKRINLPNRITAERNNTHLCFSKGERRVSPDLVQQSSFCYTVKDIDRLPLSVEIPECDCRLVFKIKRCALSDKPPRHHRQQACFDADKVTFPLHLRNVRPGDRISPFGMQGSQKIKKLFIDRKIRSDKRQTTPLLECEGEIIWVVGVRHSDYAVVSHQTRRVLDVTVEWTTQPTET